MEHVKPIEISIAIRILAIVPIQAVEIIALIIEKNEILANRPSIAIPFSRWTNASISLLHHVTLHKLPRGREAILTMTSELTVLTNRGTVKSLCLKKLFVVVRLYSGVIRRLCVVLIASRCVLSVLHVAPF